MKRANKVAKLEGKRSQTSIGNTRETLSCEEQLIAQELLQVYVTSGYEPDLAESTTSYRGSPSLDELLAGAVKKYQKLKKAHHREMNRLAKKK